MLSASSQEYLALPDTVIVRQIEPTPTKHDFAKEYVNNVIASFQLDPPCGAFQRGYLAAAEEFKRYLESL